MFFPGLPKCLVYPLYLSSPKEKGPAPKPAGFRGAQCSEHVGAEGPGEGRGGEAGAKSRSETGSMGPLQARGPYGSWSWAGSGGTGWWGADPEGRRIQAASSTATCPVCSALYEGGRTGLLLNLFCQLPRTDTATPICGVGPGLGDGCPRGRRGEDHGARTQALGEHDDAWRLFGPPGLCKAR